MADKKAKRCFCVVGTLVEEMAIRVKSEFRRQCGIVYCLSRQECEQVADELNANGLSAIAYHAGICEYI